MRARHRGAPASVLDFLVRAGSVNLQVAERGPQMQSDVQVTGAGIRRFFKYDCVAMGCADA